MIKSLIYRPSEIADYFLSRYGDESDITPNGTPWSKTWSKLMKNENTLSLQIPETEIRDYYKSKYMLAQDSVNQ